MTFRKKLLTVLSGLIFLGFGVQSISTAQTGGPVAKAWLATSFAFDAQGTLWLVGIDRSGALFTQTSATNGRTWSSARVIDVGERVSADGENRPKIAFGPGGAIVITYTRPGERPYSGDIRLTRSEDHGMTFSKPKTVQDDKQPITHRFESIMFDKAGNLHVVWIDKRDAELTRSLGGGKDAYAGAGIYRKVSSDAGATFGPDIKVAGPSCQCCRIALSPVDEGVAALWRHIFDGHIRDHAFFQWARNTEARQPAPTLVRATYDDWMLKACPHHGPGLAPAQDGGFHAVWYGVRDGQAAVRYGRLSALGSPEGKALVIPDARAEHADVLSWGQRVAIVWRSFDGVQSSVRALVSDDGGGTFSERWVFRSSEPNDHPRVFQRGGEFFVGWRTESGVHVTAL